MNPIFKEFFKPCDDMEKKALATLQRAREVGEIYLYRF